MDKVLTSGLLETFRQETLRWNRQINLVSRQETGDRLEGLLVQCRAGVPVAEAWLKEAPDSANVWYFDLGSGGGLPGIVWHLLLSGKHPISTVLVEPREKRAWFLERMARVPGMPPFRVINDRWGEGPVALPRATPSAVLVSLKALKLPDGEILAGLARFFGAGRALPRVFIARYYPPGQAWSPKLAESLAIPLPGQRADGGAGHLVSTASGVVSLGPQAGASLIVSSYHPQ